MNTQHMSEIETLITEYRKREKEADELRAVLKSPEYNDRDGRDIYGSYTYKNSPYAYSMPLTYRDVEALIDNRTTIMRQLKERMEEL